jgi:hypothetical protein
VRLRTFKLDNHAVGVIADEAREVLLGCEAIHEGSKSYPLDDTADSDTLAKSSRIGVGEGG